MRADTEPQSDPNEPYFSVLAELTAQGRIEDYSELNDQNA
jgi:hypothetical protein